MKKCLRLWVVFQLKGKWRKPEDGGSVIEFQGVFSTEQKAIDACRDENYFMAPVKLDKELPHESIQMNGGCYPKLI